MPAKFHAVSPTIWDRTQRQLGGPAKVVRYYVQTCPTRVSEGLFQLPLGILVHDTGLSETHARQGLAELEAAGLVSYDEAGEVVLDRVALKVNPIRNGTVRDGPRKGEVKADNRIPGALRMFEQVPDSPLKVEFVKLARAHSPDLADALVAEFGVTEEGPIEDPGRSLQGPSREEQRRVEPDTRGEDDSGVRCSRCGEPALKKGGVVDLGPDGKPWCGGWCEVAA